MPPKAYILMTYPISQGFRQKVDAIAGPGAVSLLLAELRMMGIAGMIRYLRNLSRQATIYIPIEDHTSGALLPALIGVAALSSANRTIVILPDGSLRPISGLQCLAAILSAALSTVLGGLALLRTWFQVRYLASCPVLETEPDDAAKEILYLNANLWFGVRAGGSVGHIAGVINGFTDLGYRVHLASANPQVMLRDSVKQTVLEAPKTFGFPYELNYFRYNRSVIQALRRMPRVPYRFCYQRMSVMNYAGVVLSRVLGIPLVLEYNGSEVWVAKNWGRGMRFAELALAMEAVCLRHAHRIVVVSDALKEELVSRGIDPAKVISYPNCVDPVTYNPEVPAPERAALRRAIGASSDGILIMFVGTFGQWHGASVLAMAIQRLVNNERDWLDRHRVRFALVGDGLKMKEVRQLIGGAEYASHVVFTGLIPQVETIKYLASADILVSPHVRNQDGSKFFGSPTKLFEYMAMAKGIVASDLDQIGEVLAGGIRIWQSAAPSDAAARNATAILIRPGEVDDLIAGIKLLVAEPERRRRLGVNARAKVLNQYTWRHHVGSILGATGGEISEKEAEVAIA